MWTDQLATTVQVILWACGAIAGVGGASVVVIKVYQFIKKPSSATLKLIESNQQAIQQNQKTIEGMVEGQKHVYSGMLAIMNAVLHPDDPGVKKETQEAYKALQKHLVNQ